MAARHRQPAGSSQWKRGTGRSGRKSNGTRAASKLSPAFLDDKKTGEVLKITSVGLVNNPAIPTLPAVASQSGGFMEELLNSLRKALGLGEVDIHATAQGRVIPAGKTKPVAPSESASVAAIRVRDGDRVAEGQTLVELDRTSSVAEVRRLERERWEQELIAARLRALLDGRERLDLPAGLTVPPPLAVVHEAQLRHKLADHRFTIGALEREREQRQADAHGAEAELARLEKTVPLLEERVGAKDALARKGFGTRNDYLALAQDLVDRQQQLITARHRLTETRAAIAAVGQRLAQAEAQFRADALTQQADAEQKAASLAQELAKAEQRDRLLRLTAPVAGVVQQLTVNAPGAVVAQGQPVLMIVPEGDGIAIEAALQNKDVGYVRPGQPVEIKVESFPFTRYGTVPGEVAVVSGDTVQTADSDPTRKPAAASDPASTGTSRDSLGPVYAVRIKPLRATLRVEGRDEPLTPGMAVTAEIKTGKRRLIEYILDPVMRYQAESLRER
ncbi:MAG: HlyD family type I secretion periplasmic adaptor subunit [Alphaproteobacteria bacterium]|nr:HlyD family type I secretion periplasmic adaptor subunit [Alphaproteobacteria bacterium]